MITPETLEQFALYGVCEDVRPFGNGHINDTFVSRWDQGGTPARYTHQRINDHVFPRPDQVMDNILRITAHLARKLAGVPGRSRRVLQVVPARDGTPYVRDAAGGWWRTYCFIENAHAGTLAASPEEARLLGGVTGAFQRLLADLPGPRLHETIPAFHDMEARYRRFHQALKENPRGRAGDCPRELAFLLENEERGGALTRALREGRIPERIAHNDAKMNNILLDDAGGGALCLIDLDTVMPGTGLFDLGDLVRTAASTALEDERDENLVRFDPLMYRALLEGYLGETRGFLTPGETGLLAEAGRCIIQIMALRFLTDYLEGDHYYHTARPGHNLDRCRNQLALLRSLDDQWDAARGIAEELTRAG